MAIRPDQEKAVSPTPPPRSGRFPVPFGEAMTPEERMSRMLEIMDDLEPLAFLRQEDFLSEDRREEAGAYAAALGRCASKLPDDVVRAHPEIDWQALEELRRTDFHDKIDVLVLRDSLQEILPDLRIKLERILATPVV
ncbi:MAG TPA: hypothetical protein VLN41_00895 [Candidatus Bathyarchaeia archaeon]|nr:hypothetical protein [Candidatus Bathyarchaeia archaeon]